MDRADLSIDAVAGAGWSARDVAVEVSFQRTGATVRIGTLHLASLSQELRKVEIRCPQVELSSVTIGCKQARVAADWRGIGPQSFTAGIQYGRRDGSLRFDATGIRLGQGTAQIDALLHRGAWRATARVQRAPVDLLMKLAAQMGLRVPPLSATGLMNLSATANGAGTSLRESVIDASLADLTANNESGSIATDKLSLAVQAKLRKAANGWQFTTELRSGAGQAYAQPIFLDFGAHAIAVSAQGRVAGDGHELMIERFTLDHTRVARATGHAHIDFAAAQSQPLRSLALTVEQLEFPGAYESYLQPLLLDTSFKAMKTSGSLAGEVQVQDGAPLSVDLRVADLGLDDGSRKLVLDSLQGEWHWHAHPLPNPPPQAGEGRVGVQDSRLSWRSGTLYGMKLGAAGLQFSTSARQFRLLQPVRIPLLDGAVAFESFRIRNAGTPQVAFMIDAQVEPIDVQQLCRAFGWPEFGGHVGGSISKLRMRDGVITLGTVLRAQVFDGTVTLSDLRLEQPFGQWPRFSASIGLDDLDLELVTRAFSFGRITGRLSGSFQDLKLFNWTPIAFDARLYTPTGDRSRHRISQRAVENIGSIGGGGGGVTAALSSGFLRFFDDFNYDRLGWSCRLQNEVCTMDGVATAPNGGYYLVQGKGLPRIDVIGSSRRVDWPRLVQQLVDATRSQGPVVAE